MLGNNLKKMRFERKLSLRALSEKSGVSKTSISEMENGIVTNPTLDTLLKLADALEVSVDRLTGKAAISIIEDNLEKIGMSLDELSEKAKVPIHFLQTLNNITPMEDDYNYMTRVAKVLNLRPGILHAALARQEPPFYDPDDSFKPEDFKPEDFFKVLDDEEPAEYEQKVDLFNDLTEDEIIVVRAFIQTYRQIKKSIL